VKRRTLLGSALVLAAAPVRLAAQGTQKIARIGWVTAQQASSLTPYVEAFRSGLADLGYVEGRNLALVLRYGDDHLDRVPELAADLVRVPVDLIVAQGDTVAFVEVKARKGSEFGDPVEAVNWSKQKELARSASVWIHRHGRPSDSYRFDVVGILVEGERVRVRHVPNAFSIHHSA